MTQATQPLPGSSLLDRTVTFGTVVRRVELETDHVLGNLVAVHCLDAGTPNVSDCYRSVVPFKFGPECEVPREAVVTSAKPADVEAWVR